MTIDFIPRRHSRSIAFKTFAGSPPSDLVLYAIPHDGQALLNIGIDEHPGSFMSANLTRTQVAGLIQTLQSWMLNSKLPEDPQPLKASTSETTTNVPQA